MAKVYVSSTVADLKRERRAVMEWLVAAGHQPVHSYLPNSDTVRDSCLEDVANCDLYVLVLGHRYGFQPADGNPGGLSITHLEFRRAGECGIPRLALLCTRIPDDGRLSDVQDPARAPLVSEFRDEVTRLVRPAEFSNRRGLIQGLSTGIQAELDKLSKRDERQAVQGARSASAADSSLAPIADQLAIAVGTQWEAEARVRRLNDPYPLPVSWAAADTSLTDTWGSLVKLASTGAGWPAPPHAGSWAANSDDLAGEGGELAEVLARVPTGRLVVLGEPGAGKTMLMVRLVLDLLARRASGGPVPFLVSIASWSPEKQDLRGWLTGQLLTDHPALAASRKGRTEPTKAAALLGSGLILPILDGLDEIPERVRGSAISRINDALRPGEQVVVTCRTQHYRDAVRPVDGIEVTLRAFAAVELRPLDADAVRNYLLEDAAGPTAKARWDPVLAVLRTEVPAGQAFCTPLMVGLARIIYSPRPGELSGTLPEPSELLGLADRTAVEARLLDAFIPAAYRHDRYGRWKIQDAEKWLVFLARHLELTSSSDLAWWQLSRALMSATIPTRLTSLIQMASAIAIPIVGGTPTPIATIAGIDWRWFPMGAPSSISSAASPKAALALARISAIGLWASAGVVFGVLWGVLWGVVGGVLGGVTRGVTFGVIMATMGAVVGGAMMASRFIGLWVRYVIARTWLALRRRLPWSLMSFLTDAHKRGVLRQAGAVYQFRHIELQHRLANRDAST